MKKFLAFTALALGAFTLATTTHAAEFYTKEDASKLTDCDLLKSYHSDEHAVPGSYLEVNCHFSASSNDVTLTTDNQPVWHGMSQEHKVGCYYASLHDIRLPKGNYYFVYQMIEGSHSPNWCVLSVDNVLPNMTDHNVHVSKAFALSNDNSLEYDTNFGGWFTGSERIAIYACVK